MAPSDAGPSPAPRHPVKTTSKGEHGGRFDIETKAQSGTVISVTSDPSNAEVYVNGQFQGFTPLTMENLDSGAYNIQIRKSGYYPVTRRIDISADTNVSIDATLSPVTGYLSIGTTPPDAEVYVDGRRVHDIVVELPIGIHRVRVARFAYRDFRTTVQIYANSTTAVTASLERAAFNLTDLSVGRRTFNPHNPGPLGTSVIQFRVSSYGHATVSIRRETSDTVKTFVIQSFHQWQQQVSWNGTDMDGKTVPDGTYLVSVSATPADGGPAQDLTTTVSVNSTISIRYRSMLSGAPGLAYSPIADTLPFGSLQVGTQFLAHTGYDAQNALVARVPLVFGLRYGLPSALEFDASAQGVLNTNQALNDGSVSLGLRWRYASLSMGSGLVGIDSAVASRVTFLSSAATDTLTNFDGVSISAPVSFHIGPLGLGLSAEVLASTYPVAPVVQSPAAGVYLWAYGRTGIYIDTPTVLAGVSAAVRSLPFLAPVGTGYPDARATIGGWVQLPMEVSAEAHFMIPGTSFVVSITGAGEVTSLSDYYVSAGGGFAFLY